MPIACTLTELELLHNTLTYKIYLCLTPFIISIGLLGNILTVCVFFLTDLKRQSVSIITIALAIADSFVLLIPVSILWLETILRQELTDVSSFWCRTHGQLSPFSPIHLLELGNFPSRFFRFDLYLLFQLVDGLHRIRTFLCCLVTS